MRPVHIGRNLAKVRHGSENEGFIFANIFIPVPHQYHKELLSNIAEGSTTLGIPIMEQFLDPTTL